MATPESCPPAVLQPATSRRTAARGRRRRCSARPCVDRLNPPFDSGHSQDHRHDVVLGIRSTPVSRRRVSAHGDCPQPGQAETRWTLPVTAAKPVDTDAGMRACTCVSQRAGIARKQRWVEKVGLAAAGRSAGATLGCDQGGSRRRVSTHSGDMRRLAGYLGSSTPVTWRPQLASASDIPAVTRAGTVSEDSCSASSSLKSARQYRLTARRSACDEL
jgi:hypothetical protein